MSESFSPRSVLFVPGNATDKLAKVARVAPDAVIVDLEDAVSPAEKDTARDATLAALAAARPAADRVFVRVNGVGTSWYDADVEAAARALSSGSLDGVVLPKYERVAELAALRAALPARALVIGGLESALGVADARELLAGAPDARVDAAYFGAEDYVADLGGRRTPAGDEVLYARSQVSLAARLAGIAALDQVVVAVRDAEAFRADARRGLSLGFRGKICLHPIQVTVAHEVFTPSPAEIEHARAVLAAASASTGVTLVDGQMIDAVHLAMARATLARVPAD
jgi:citrate lyase subunit beta / citryl-CoA lyase